MRELLACPNCGNTKWMLGPCGGMAQNIECATCGNDYNDMGPFGLEHIGFNRSGLRDLLPSAGAGAAG